VFPYPHPPGATGYILYATPDNTWEFWVGTGAGGWVSTGDAPVTNDVWTHLATVYDAGTKTMALYVNGQLASSRANVTLARNTQRPFRVGAGVTEGAPQFFFAGLIDDVRVHGNALTQAEIQALAIAALHRLPPMPPQGRRHRGLWHDEPLSFARLQCAGPLGLQQRCQRRDPGLPAGNSGGSQQSERLQRATHRGAPDLERQQQRRDRFPGHALAQRRG
jgi:hypothetical protein